MIYVNGVCVSVCVLFYFILYSLTICHTSVLPRAYAWVQLKIITIIRFKLYMVLVYTFFKPYIYKICNDFSYIYIYI